jgi:hypothetical protein
MHGRGDEGEEETQLKKKEKERIISGLSKVTRVARIG